MGTKTVITLAVLLCGLLMVGGGVWAMSSGSYAINWNVIGGGGEPISSANYAIGGTIGQPAAESSFSTNYGLWSGYWYPAAPAAPPEEPTIAFDPTSFSFYATEGGANPADQTLEVWNSGSGTLDWSVADGAAWLGLDPPSGSSTGEHNAVTVSVDISGMSANNYDATITISAPGATNTPQTVPVNLTINPAGAGVTWNFPSTSDVFLCPTSANSRPYLDAAVSLPTGTEPAELLGVYWLDEATGGWQYFIPAFGGGTLTALEPGEAYLVAVSGGCGWNLPCGEGTGLPTGNIWSFPSTSDVFLCPTSANSRPYLDATVSLPTGTEPAELLGVYWLDEATGGWQYFIPAFGGGTLTSLEPGEAYLVAVSGDCNWQLS
jgi:hypothetical protein